MHTQINPVDTRPHSRTTFTPSFWFAKKKKQKIECQVQSNWQYPQKPLTLFGTPEIYQPVRQTEKKRNKLQKINTNKSRRRRRSRSQY